MLFSNVQEKNPQLEFHILLNYQRKAKPTLFLISKAPGITMET